MSKHRNSGDCEHCDLLFATYPGFHTGLKHWFKELQRHCPEAHISCAGRGQVEQESLLQRGATRAAFGKSSHNWNAAIDIFRNVKGKLYEIEWFNGHVEPFLEDWLTWYGAQGSPFWELPHVEVKDWRTQAKNGHLRLVEDES